MLYFCSNLYHIQATAPPFVGASAWLWYVKSFKMTKTKKIFLWYRKKVWYDHVSFKSINISPSYWNFKMFVTESCLIKRPPPLVETQIFEIIRKASFCRRETCDTALEPPKCVLSSYKKHNDVRTSGTWSAHTRHTLKMEIFGILLKTC